MRVSVNETPRIVREEVRWKAGYKYELFFTIFRIVSCIGEIISRSGSMFLKLNGSKLDLLCFSKSSRLIESLFSINISSNLSLVPSSTMHNFGFFYSSISLIPQLKFVAKSSFFHLHRIKQPKLFLDNPTLSLGVSSVPL